MKTLENLSVSSDGKKVTITADLVEREFSKIPMQQVTMLHFAEGNPRWVRHVQMSNEALFVRRMRDGLALDLESWVTAVANVLEPKLAAPPKGAAVKYPDNLKAEILSELHPTFQWQVSDKPNTPNDQWSSIDGQTSDLLNITPEMKGKFVRCFAKTDAGNVATPPVAV